MPTRRGLNFALCGLLLAGIIGMLPVMPALAASSEFGINVDSVLTADGLISRLLGGEDDEDNEKDDDDKDKDDDSKKERPRAYDQSVEVDEDSSIRIELEASTEKDRPLTFVILEEPANGKLVEFDDSGSVTYEPGPNFYGSDSFTFKASDGDEESRAATVIIRVESINDIPEALAASIATREGSSVSFELRGTDVESEDLEYIIISGPSHGKLEGSAPNLTYKPDSRFDGSDELMFKVNDGTNDSEQASVKIKVREKDKDRDESDKWWEKTPVTPKPTEPSGVTADASGNSTEVAPQSAEPAQVVAVAQPFEPISPNPIITTVTPPNEIIDEPAMAAIVDRIPPQLILPGSLLNMIATSKEGAIVNFEAKALDDVDGEIPAHCSPTSGSVVPVGTVNIVCTATDAAGNSALDSFTVAVSPITAGQSAITSISFLVSGLLAAVLGASGYFGFRTVRRRKARD